MNSSTAQGQLAVVATPIGNLADLSERAKQTLADADVILAEDTRNTKQLLQLAGVHYQKLVSLHEHNEVERAKQVASWLDAGQNLALVSDAGTPLISDPGYAVVNLLREAGYDLVAVPGPCALIAALSISGLPTDRFTFEGFLPAKSGARKKRLQEIASNTGTSVMYESTHRIEDMLADIGETMPGRQVVIARELTKKFETVLTGTGETLVDQLKADPMQKKGEFVVMVAGNPEGGAGQLSEQQVIAALSELPTKQAAKIMAQLFGGNKREWYAKLDS
ncbi:16S rRNA (cytidine(1402)-2'-O)-methyltransferase [Salinibius halmophilus]|uniref:16S rRNA (cytidine(1402)-2'-O)-methyltransferase n=1 Tax=Salinibius halmophilus TaxID=1853216 RepID=UPI000E67187A|nr:16S rRNA (cytidine(1402)-2'-O)-methyltransferase [Salinibius halmophilus]